MISSDIEPEQDIRNLYIVTSLFNPCGFQKRYDLYYQFEAQIKQFGVKLVTIECIYECFSKPSFLVTTTGNPFHIQVRTGHPLWHKENLINIAIQHLPKDWKYVLWLDADIEFIETDWPERILKAFSKYDIIQVFKYCHFLGPDNNILESHFSFTFSIVEKIPIDKRYYSLFYPHPGYGWGMTRYAYEQLNGLIDYGILGSGDAHMAFALINQVNVSLTFPKESFHPNFLILLQKWREKAYQFTLNGRVGYAECTIRHFFHGYREDRKYVQRMTLLINGNFDPINDIFYDHNGLLQLKDHKQELKEQIFSYFQDRNEDDPGKERHLMMSKNVPNRSIEELLANANKIKDLVEKEQLRNAMLNIHKNEEHSSSLNESKLKNKRRGYSNQKIRIVNCQHSLSNLVISESDSNINECSSTSFLSNRSIKPSHSVNKNLRSEDLMYQCHSSCSKKKDKEKTSYCARKNDTSSNAIMQYQSTNQNMAQESDECNCNNMKNPDPNGKTNIEDNPYLQITDANKNDKNVKGKDITSGDNIAVDHDSSEYYNINYY